MRRRSTWLLLALTACASAPPAPRVEAPVAPRGEVTVDELRRDLTAFAHDSMRGRETGTSDAMRAARFLASRVERMGLEPAGDSLFLQRVPLQQESFTTASTISVIEGGVQKPLIIGTDVIPLTGLGPGIPPPRRRASGEIVFAGYGIATTRPRRDDLAGLDLEGKIVVVVNGAPAGTDSATRAELEAETAISDRLARILPQRPAAVVVMLAGKSSAVFEQLVPELTRGVTARGANADTPEADRPLPMILLAVPRAGSSLLPAGWPADDRPQVLRGRRLSAQIEQRRIPITGYNVVAVIRGSDPRLRNTYVAYGAHYDHIGILPATAGDSIANGADDDGSGTVSLLAIARATQQMDVKPKRSTLFVWHIGEEKGLLGSSHFTDHATVPIDSVVAHLNADMIGRNAVSELYIVGPRVAPNGQSRRLGEIVDSVNAAQPTPFVFNRAFDSAEHPEHIYERSDHFSYARKGIPIVFFTTGLHDDYHRTSDEVSKIDFDKLARVARLMQAVGTAAANSPSRPR